MIQDLRFMFQIENNQIQVMSVVIFLTKFITVNLSVFATKFFLKIKIYVNKIISENLIKYNPRVARTKDLVYIIIQHTAHR